MTKTAVNRPVTTVMCVLIVFLAGIFAYSFFGTCLYAFS